MDFIAGYVEEISIWYTCLIIVEENLDLLRILRILRMCIVVLGFSIR